MSYLGVLSSFAVHTAVFFHEPHVAKAIQGAWYCAPRATLATHGRCRKEVFTTPGVKYVDYSRDIPMDLPTVMENVLA